MRMRPQALAALLLVGAACSQAAEQPQPSADQAVTAQAPIAQAQATAGKPLIHVWKSPT